MNKQTNYFINIVIDCSFNHGFYSKRYSTLGQVLITVLSIKRNWRFPYKINLIYTGAVDEETKKVLNGLDIDLYYVKPEVETDQYSLARSTSYSLQLNQAGTHRLVMDCDMLATDNLKGQIERLLKYDIACMYEWSTNIVKSQENYDSLIQLLCNEFNFKHPSSRFVYSDNSWANDYHLTGKKLECPYYNPGVVFMREELTNEFAKRYKRLWSLLPRTQRIQVGMSIAMQELTTNIGVLEPGVNMTPFSLALSDKFKNFRNTCLLHCCGVSYDIVSELCDFYLYHEEHDWKGKEYYFNKALEKSAFAQQEIIQTNSYYDNVDIFEN